MAKKKKQTKTRSKKAEVKVEKPNFWPLAGAVILFVAALFLFIGSFGTGGLLPKDLFHGTYWLLGWAAYLVAPAFIFWGIYKFASEDHKLSKVRLVSLFAALIFAACWFFTAFASQLSNNSWTGGHGGNLGKGVGAASLNILDKFAASLLFFVLSMLAAFLALGLSLMILTKLANLFKKNKGEGELEALKNNTENNGFKLNEGVPIEHHGVGREAARLSSFKNTASKLAANENHSALTTKSDPSWKFPSIDLLNQKPDRADPGNVNVNAQTIQDTMANFNIDVEMEGANVGPRVTQYTLKPPTGVKLTKITALENNLALDLAAHSIRIEAPIPGKRAVGIEVPNIKPAMVRISSLISSDEWANQNSALTFAIGKDIAGKPVMGDLDKMPHMLIAGQTGSGKSVMINSLITSLLYRNSPSDLKLILVDPKQVELTPYNEIPHLLAPVITEPEKCISALKWAVAEMERRYRELAEVHKRNIAEYNELKQEDGMPYVVIIIDELADLMMMAAREVESLVVRVAQKSRAVGIHLVLATQRPSVDVITGLIKANVPARIAFATSSQVDSRTIIDQIGAEKLLGQGDMLYQMSDMPKPKRIQGAFIGEKETSKVVDFLREQRPPQYNDEVVSQPVQLNGKGGIVADMSGDGVDDDMWKDAVQVVLDAKKASTSLLQRRLRIGYGRAARLIETMEEQGIISPADGSRPREVLINSIDDVLGYQTEPVPVDSGEEIPDEASAEPESESID